ncbi:MAG: alanine racemase [Moraxella sp.]|nr:alanine racemase [Moraxella sp.]
MNTRSSPANTTARGTAINIHGNAICHNTRTIKNKLAPTVRLLAMVKANAYGHGATDVIPFMQDADAFGVASFAEAVQIAPITQKPIVLIEGAFHQDEWQQAIMQDFGCVLHSFEQLAWALEYMPQDGTFARSIWLKYNTGMNRLGFGDDKIIQVAKALHDKGYGLILTSHFACADEPTHPLNQQQINKFNHALQSIRQFAPNTKGSLCNSAGVFAFGNEHHDWVRTGIALYGSSPFVDISAAQLGLLPAMTLSAKIMATHTLQAGESVGYGSLWTADKPSRIGVVSIGYGDGYPRVVQGAMVSVIHGTSTHSVAIIGRVAMDMLMIDLTDMPTLTINDTVILWGSTPSIDDIARCANTIGYELMCRLTHRPTRTIINS